MSQFLYNWIMLLCALYILRLLYKAGLVFTRKGLCTTITICLHIDALLCLLRGHTPLMFSGASGSHLYFWLLNSYLGVYWVGGVLFNAIAFLRVRDQAQEEEVHPSESSPEDTQ
jgi:hypothetical protein